MPIGVPLTWWLLVLLRINGISVSWRKTQGSDFPEDSQEASSSLHKGWTVSLSEQLSSTPICLFCSKSHYLARPKLFSLICCICEELPFGCSPNILSAFSLSSLIPQGGTSTSSRQLIGKALLKSNSWGTRCRREGESGSTPSPLPLFCFLSPPTLPNAPWCP